MLHPIVMNKRISKALLVFGLLGSLNASVWAQSDNSADNPEWTEEQVPPAPTFSTTGLLPLDMPSYVSVHIGIDPKTLSVGKDGVVRYVAVMQNISGSVNAVYEGIRCASGEVKTYARANGKGEWTNASEPVWRDMWGNLPSKHALAFARSAACQGSVSSSLQEILQALKSGQKPGIMAKPS